MVLIILYGLVVELYHTAYIAKVWKTRLTQQLTATDLHYVSNPPEPQIAGPRTRCLSTTESCWMDLPIEGDLTDQACSWSMCQHWVRGSELLIVGKDWSIQPTRRSLTISFNNGLSKVNLLWIVCTALNNLQSDQVIDRESPTDQVG